MNATPAGVADPLTSVDRQRFLFVSGCPRSGTTIVTTILNWSDEAFVCQERFAPLIGRKPHLFSPELYQVPRILRFEKADCGYRSFGEAKGYSIWYANSKRFDDPGSYPVIGDKITHLFRRFGLLEVGEWAREHVTLVHVVRNPLDVAASYAARYADATDDWDWDHTRGIADWIESVVAAHAQHQALGRAGAFVLVDYDFLFGGDASVLEEHARALFARCGLVFGERQQAGMTLVHEAFGAFRRRRTEMPHIVEAVEDGIPADTMRKYHDLRRWSVEAGAAPGDPM